MINPCSPRANRFNRPDFFLWFMFAMTRKQDFSIQSSVLHNYRVWGGQCLFCCCMTNGVRWPGDSTWCVHTELEHSLQWLFQDWTFLKPRLEFRGCLYRCKLLSLLVRKWKEAKKKKKKAPCIRFENNDEMFVMYCAGLGGLLWTFENYFHLPFYNIDKGIKCNPNCISKSHNSWNN